MVAQAASVVARIASGVDGDPEDAVVGGKWRRGYLGHKEDHTMMVGCGQR